MAGQVKHTKLFADIIPDATALGVLMRLKSKNTDAIIAGVANLLHDHGIELIELLVHLRGQGRKVTLAGQGAGRGEVTAAQMGDAVLGRLDAHIPHLLHQGERGVDDAGARRIPAAGPLLERLDEVVVDRDRRDLRTLEKGGGRLDLGPGSGRNPQRVVAVRGWVEDIILRREPEREQRDRKRPPAPQRQTRSDAARRPCTGPCRPSSS